jgi:hypothetical protein
VGRREPLTELAPLSRFRKRHTPAATTGDRQKTCGPGCRLARRKRGGLGRSRPRRAGMAAASAT